MLPLHLASVWRVQPPLLPRQTTAGVCSALYRPCHQHMECPCTGTMPEHHLTGLKAKTSRQVSPGPDTVHLAKGLGMQTDSLRIMLTVDQYELGLT